MHYDLTTAFTEIPITSGTIQNINQQATVEISTSDTENTGLVLYPGEKYEWENATIYARAKWAGGEAVRIAADTLVGGSGGGGGGGSYTLPVASGSVLGGVKSSSAVGKIKVDAYGIMSYNAPDAEPLAAPEWVTNTAYAVNALVEHDSRLFMCVNAHTSAANFETDFSAGKWVALGADTVTVTKDATAQTGFDRSYTIKLNGTALTPKINIPKDYVLKSVTLKTVTTQDQPYAGAEVGSKYADFVINTVSDGDGVAEADVHKYLPMVNDYTLPIGTNSVLGGVKSSDAAGNIKINPTTGVMTYNAPEAESIAAPTWQEDTAYGVNAIVEHNNDIYMCLEAHTSGVNFDTDLAAGKWKLIGLALKAATSTQLGGVKSSDTVGRISVSSGGLMTYNAPITHADAWTSGKAYAVNDVVENSNKLYLCIEAHTSDVSFDDDLTANKWVKVGYDTSVVVAKDATAQTGYQASYTLTVNGSALTPKINIPKDYVLKSVTVKTVTVADEPYTGASVGDTYADFVINTMADGDDTAETDIHKYMPFPEYTLPTATATQLGGIKVGDGLSITDGVLSADAGAIATTEVLGSVKANDADGGVSVDADGVMTINLPKATTSSIGAVKANNADGGVSVDSDGLMTINVPTASNAVKGGVKVGTGLSMSSETLNLKKATTTTLGGVIANDAAGGVSVDTDGKMTINVPVATASALGGVKSSTTAGKIAVDANGLMSVNDGKYLPLTGGTMTGNIITERSYPSYTCQFTGIERGVAPSSNIYNDILRSNDKNSAVLGGVEQTFKPSGYNEILLYARDANDAENNTSAMIGVGFDDNHNATTFSSVTPELGDASRNIATTNWTVAKGHYENAYSHNAHYRGRDLTSYFASGDMSTAIAAGTFTNIYPGDYITKSVTIDGTTYSNVKWVVMDLDYFLHASTFDLTTHHVVLMPEDTLIFGKSMNSTNTTEGGYIGSNMWTTEIPKIDTGIEGAFGSSHVLSHSECLSNAIDTTVVSGGYSGWTGASSNWEWTDVKSNIPNEPMVFGCHPCSSSLFDIGNCPIQFAAFRHKPNLRSLHRRYFWLRAVVSSSYFAISSTEGRAAYYSASNAFTYGGIRPYFLLK